MCSPRRDVLSLASSASCSSECRGGRIVALSVRLPECMLSPVLCFEGLVLLIQSSGFFRVFPPTSCHCLLHQNGLVGLHSERSDCVDLAFSIAIPLLSVRVKFFLRLSCPSLVLVYCSPGIFFTCRA